MYRLEHSTHSIHTSLYTHHQHGLHTLIRELYPPSCILILALAHTSHICYIVGSLTHLLQQTALSVHSATSPMLTSKIHCLKVFPLCLLNASPHPAFSQLTLSSRRFVLSLHFPHHTHNHVCSQEEL